MSPVSFDAIIIGAGLNGSWAAKVLTEGGMNVALLDAGPELSEDVFSQKVTKTDFFDPRFHLFRMKALIKGDFDRALNKFLDYRTQDLALSTQDYPYSTLDGKSYRWFRVRKVGGRGHLWGRVMLRLTDREFSANDLNESQTSWPIRYSDLEAFYDEVETLLELGGAASNTSAVPDGQYIHERSLNHLESLFKDSVEEKWPERHVLVNHVAEYEPSPLSPMLIAAKRTGCLQLFASTAAKHVITCPETGNSIGVSAIDLNSGEKVDFWGDNIILSASPYETVRILLSSVSSKHPQGLGNSFGQLGTQILEHVVCSFMAELPDTLRENNANYIHNPFKLNDAPHGFYIPTFRKQESDSLDFKRDYGIQGLISPESGLFYMGLFGETLPRPENCLKLNSSVKDKLGMPTLKIEFSWSENELNMLKDQKKVALELAKIFEDRVGVKLNNRIATRVHNHLWA